MRKKILVAATRTVPSTLYRVGAALVEHLHDQVTMQTHGRMTIDPFAYFCGFRHDSHLLTSWSSCGLHPISRCRRYPRVKTISYNCLQKERNRSYTDGETIKRL